MAGVMSAQYAGWGTRFLAAIIDGIIIGVVYFVLSFAVGLAIPGPAAPSADALQSDPNAASNYLVAATGHATTVLAIVVPLVLIVGIVYYAYMWSRSGQTLGQKLLHIKVTRQDGQLLSLGGGILRYIVGMAILDNIVFGLPIGWLWPLWDGKKQAWHDKIAGSIVVKA
jgi:uncharacterized RDD family membrane protein YckC